MYNLKLRRSKTQVLRMNQQIFSSINSIVDARVTFVWKFEWKRKRHRCWEWINKCFSFSFYYFTTALFHFKKMLVRKHSGGASAPPQPPPPPLSTGLLPTEIREGIQMVPLHWRVRSHSFFLFSFKKKNTVWEISTSSF